MEIKEFDKVLLKTGETAYVVDVDKIDGDIETTIVEQNDIEKVLS